MMAEWSSKAILQVVKTEISCDILPFVRQRMLASIRRSRKWLTLPRWWWGEFRQQCCPLMWALTNAVLHMSLPGKEVVLDVLIERIRRRIEPLEN